MLFFLFVFSLQNRTFGFAEGTLARENPKIFWFSSRLFVPLALPNVGCISEISK